RCDEEEKKRLIVDSDLLKSDQNGIESKNSLDMGTRAMKC
ncbi:MAG: hypothetical protein PWR09_965, partial [Archaeoglobi archaeon]|nr:hypothetical protein [Archaeoglobi archaeon]